MSDSIPIIFHVVQKAHLVDHFGDEIGGLLAAARPPIRADVRSYDARWKSIAEGERKLEASSRGGMIIFALGKLIEKAGMKQLGFLANQSCTHEIVVSADWGQEIFRFTVMTQPLDSIANAIRAFLSWCRDNPTLTSEEFWGNFGNDIDGREFESVADVLDNVRPSLDPNEEICDSDSWNAALAFSVLKTIIELLDYASAENYWVVCEHWGGFESA
ncbi:MAG: hypothetical protein B7Z35_03065 [Hydrogenophilales bacterium 12-61-10]|nr:hypothetical protein [Halothiobacillaceae bacterium]OYW39882.1 MAG: hypothetical protein B7Z35_03065 [Hydrogenophilales bacterium 12-61-10]